jgi:hypothetical protein
MIIYEDDNNYGVFVSKMNNEETCKEKIEERRNISLIINFTATKQAICFLQGLISSAIWIGMSNWYQTYLDALAAVNRDICIK